MTDIPKMLRAEARIADEDWTGIYGISPNLAFAAADRIKKLEAVLEVATMKRIINTDRIEKLEAALRKIKDLHHGPEDEDVLWIRDDMTYKIVCDTLEGKDD